MAGKGLSRGVGVEHLRIARGSIQRIPYVGKTHKLEKVLATNISQVALASLPCFPIDRLSLATLVGLRPVPSFYAKSPGTD